MSPLPWIADTSTKAGEVFRNNKGQYSFLCIHCCLTFEDFGEIVNHCDSHYDNDEKCEVDVRLPEFALCGETKSELAHELFSPKPASTSIELPVASNESTQLTVKSDVQVRKAAKRKKPKEIVNVPQQCPVCEVWCDDFQDHMKTAHEFNGRVYQCFICSSFFKRLIALKQHLSSTNHTKYKCYHCEMEPPVMNATDARRHKCLFCKEWFPNHVEFKIHFRMAHGKDADYFFRKRSNCNIFTCYVCEREFPLRYYLAAHMKIHHDKFLRHQCPSCGKRVRTFGQLTQHLKTHEGKIYTCDQCDKQFQYYARLRLHLASHKTELNFVCNVCSKAFKLRKYLNTHMAVHTNAKKYACKFCAATFNFTSGRRAHEKSQHKAI